MTTDDPAPAERSTPWTEDARPASWSALAVGARRRSAAPAGTTAVAVAARGWACRGVPADVVAGEGVGGRGRALVGVAGRVVRRGRGRRGVPADAAVGEGVGGHRRRSVVAVAAAVLCLGVAGCGGDGGDGEAGAERQAEVADRGADVMPFDLDATTHRFEPTPDGLVQTVVADDPEDAGQVDLVRQHLAEEAERFSAGDYGDPASIHGDDMPGLAELEAGADAIEVAYDDTADGARLTYTTSEPALVDALHRWSEAQVMDHGAHAEAG